MIKQLTTANVLIFLFLFFYSISVHSQVIYKCNDGWVQFSSDAELELIKATSKKLTGVLDTSKKVFAFSVAINSFEGFNAELQKEHFNENYLESSKYYTANFKGKIIEDIDFTQQGIYQVRCKGALNIHGVERERIIKTKIHVRDGAINASSDFSVLLKDHSIKIPKVVHENIAAEIEVIVDVNFILTK